MMGTIGKYGADLRSVTWTTGKPLAKNNLELRTFKICDLKLIFLVIVRTW